MEIFNWKSAGKAIIDTAVIFVFTVIATIASFIVFKIKSDNEFDWSKTYSNGNYFLYSISLLSSSYVYFLRKKDKVIGKTIVIVIMVICAIIYSQFADDKKSTTLFTYYGSIIMLSVASISFFITQYYQHFDLIDPNDEDKKNQKGIAKNIIF
jgi:hypothetical protein